MIIRTLPTPLNLHVLFAPWCIPLSEPWPLTPVGHMHLFTLYAIIKATSPMSLIASLVASSNLFCIILYLSIAVLFAGNKSTTTTTTSDTGPHLNIKVTRYGDFHVKDTTVARPSYLQHGAPYTGKSPLDATQVGSLKEWFLCSGSVL